jgi:hypothetical protein
MTSPRTPASGGSTRSLGLIRAAILVGVLSFGAFSYATRESRELRPRPELHTPLLVVWVFAIVVIVFCISRLRAVRDEGVRGQVSLIGWAAAEGAALFGGAYYFFTGDAHWYGAGLLLMGMTFIAIPLRRE